MHRASLPSQLSTSVLLIGPILLGACAGTTGDRAASQPRAAVTHEDPKPAYEGDASAWAARDAAEALQSRGGKDAPVDVPLALKTPLTLRDIAFAFDPIAGVEVPGPATKPTQQSADHTAERANGGWSIADQREGLRTGGGDQAMAAVRSLSSIGLESREAVEVLKGALTHKYPLVRRAAAVAVARLDAGYAPAREELKKFAREGDLSDRVEVAEALVRTYAVDDDVVDALREGLKFGNDSVKATALDAAGRLPAATADPLIPAIERLIVSNAPPVRWAAFGALDAIRPFPTDDVALRRLMASLKADAEADRIAAAASISAMGEKGAAAKWLLIRRLGSDGSIRLRATIPTTLAKVAPTDGVAFAAVLGAFERAVVSAQTVPAAGPESELVTAAAQALREMTPPAETVVEQLLPYLSAETGRGADNRSANGSYPPPLRAVAHETLARLGEKALPPLRDRLAKGRDFEKPAAVHGIAVIAIESDAAMEDLRTAFTTADLDVRSAAIWAAAGMGRRAAPLVPQLTQVLNDRLERGNVELDGPLPKGAVIVVPISDCSAAMTALAAVGHDAGEALAPLRKMAMDAALPVGSDLRQQAAMTFLTISAVAPNAMEMAEVLLRTKYYKDVLRMADQLDDPKRVAAAILPIAAGAPEESSELAFAALARIGPNAAGVAPALAEMLDGADNAKRIAAARTLAAIGPAAKAPSVARLGRMADNGDPAVRRAAVDALLALDPEGPQVAAAYLAAVRRSDPFLARTLAPRVRAVEASAQRVVPKLTQLAASDPDREVRDLAAKALREVTGDK